jgi:hypothetical protein
MGIDKTVRRIQQQFYWPTWFKDVADYRKTCTICQKLGPQRLRKAPMVRLPIIHKPFERIALDIVGPLPQREDTF